MSPLRPSRRLAGLLIVLAASAGVVLATAPAGAVPTPPNRLTLTAATQSFTSSSGKPLTVDLAAGGGTITVRVATPGQPETHTWAFPFPDASDISYDPATGEGALTSGASIQPFGSVALTLTAIGKSTVVGCGPTRTDVQPVSIAGTFAFQTHTAWGRVGGTTRQTFTGNSTLSIFDGADKLCGSTLPPCVVTSVWEAHNIASDLMGFTQFIGTSTTVGSTTTSTLLAKRLTYLATPSGATRTDVSSIPIANPSFAFADPAVTVTVPSRGANVTGSARLAGTSENPGTPLSCGDAKHRTTDSQWLATYTNGPTPFVVHEQVAGTFKLTNVAGESNKANATIDRTVTTTA